MTTTHTIPAEITEAISRDPALTNDDIRLLRAANEGVSFFREYGHEYVRATKRLDDGDGFGSRQVDRYLPLTTTLERYGVNGKSETRPEGFGEGTPGDTIFAVGPIMYPRVNPEWQTVLYMLKAGDTLHAHWVSGNAPKSLHEIGWTVDEFHLRVLRPVKNKSHRILTFILRIEVGPIDSVMRLVKTK